MIAADTDDPGPELRMRSGNLNAIVRRICVEARDTISIDLRPADQNLFPAFDAGAHIGLHLPNGIVRNYSLVNAPQERDRYLLGVLRSRVSRGGSSFIHESLREGDRLIITYPRNNFRLDESGERYVLIAGGIGVTPIYCMAQRLLSLGKCVEMLYCCRSRKHAAWLRSIESLDIPLTLHFDAEQGGPLNLGAFMAGRDHETRYYCCGPTQMLGDFERTSAQYGYPHAHIERFEADPVLSRNDNPGYDVLLARSGRLVHVEPGARLLDALLRAGVDVPFSCVQGFCGSCEVAVLDGKIHHRDSVLSEAERVRGRSLMTCVSSCDGGRLILDC
ncbi:ferredoxin-NADP reductase [Bradyrhizobium macuxiense]|uniref:Ferredoxin-NADP reductase n=1 Tax=Bradyrhizobium macuxiense TaxID=1755647 RepID=A0A560KS35_9BRAD|nr:PDR/VanB family oxidoreductase [Bradyrhizobium macuxiense]TWB85997.1 ferredoxin-NADP reductase [Bradyrhizobium macuxiense]